MHGFIFWIGIFGIAVSIFTIFLSAYAQAETYPIGIASNGKNQENQTVSYEIDTNSVIGIVHINSIGVDPPNSGASLQLNAVLHVITTNGTVDYWAQNVLQVYNTDYQSSGLLDNVWKFTSSGDVSQPSNPLKVCIKIPFTSHLLCRDEQLLYKFADQSLYKLPFDKTLVITEKTILGKGVEVQFIYIENGNAHVYDTRMLAIPNVTSAYFLVTPNSKIDNYLSYDAELVWGGRSDGVIANFTSMDSKLYLFYNDTGQQNPSQPYLVNPWKSFPGYITRGYDTAETARNIYSTLSPNNNGTAVIELGNPPSQNNSSTSTTISEQIPSQSMSYLLVSTDKQSYTDGETVEISGRINATSQEILKFWITDARDNVMYSHQIDSPPLAGFTWNVPTDSSWNSGIYTLSVQYGSAAYAKTAFVLNNLQTVSAPLPQTANSSYPSFLSIDSAYLLGNTEINYGIPNGKIVNMELQQESKSISIETESTETSPLGIDLPEPLIKFNADPQIFVDGVETGYGYKVKTQDGIALSISVPSGDHKIEIIGSQITVPEFGSLASMVFLIGIITTLAISSKIRSELT